MAGMDGASLLVTPQSTAFASTGLVATGPLASGMASADGFASIFAALTSVTSDTGNVPNGLVTASPTIPTTSSKTTEAAAGIEPSLTRSTMPFIDRGMVESGNPIATAIKAGNPGAAAILQHLTSEAGADNIGPVLISAPGERPVGTATSPTSPPTLSATELGLAVANETADQFVLEFGGSEAILVTDSAANDSAALVGPTSPTVLLAFSSSQSVSVSHLLSPNAPVKTKAVRLNTSDIKVNQPSALPIRTEETDLTSKIVKAAAPSNGQALEIGPEEKADPAAILNAAYAQPPVESNSNLAPTVTPPLPILSETVTGIAPTSAHVSAEVAPQLPDRALPNLALVTAATPAFRQDIGPLAQVAVLQSAGREASVVANLASGPEPKAAIGGPQEGVQSGPKTAPQAQTNQANTVLSLLTSMSGLPERETHLQTSLVFVASASATPDIAGRSPISSAPEAKQSFSSVPSKIAAKLLNEVISPPNAMAAPETEIAAIPLKPASLTPASTPISGTLSPAVSVEMDNFQVPLVRAPANTAEVTQVRQQADTPQQLGGTDTDLSSETTQRTTIAPVTVQPVQSKVAIPTIPAAAPAQTDPRSNDQRTPKSVDMPDQATLQPTDTDTLGPGSIRPMAPIQNSIPVSTIVSLNNPTNPETLTANLVQRAPLANPMAAQKEAGQLSDGTSKPTLVIGAPTPELVGIATNQTEAAPSALLDPETQHGANPAALSQSAAPLVAIPRPTANRISVLGVDSSKALGPGILKTDTLVEDGAAQTDILAGGPVSRKPNPTANSDALPQTTTQPASPLPQPAQAAGFATQGNAATNLGPLATASMPDEAATAPTISGFGDGAFTSPSVSVFDAGSSQSAGLNTERPSQARPHAETPQLLGQMIARRVDSGLRSFAVRLDPAELGRVDVTITMTKDRKVTASLSVERPETLGDLTRASREITRALLDAGLDLADGGLSFSLNEHSRGQQKWAEANSNKSTADRNSEPKLDATPTHSANPQRWGRSRLMLEA
jgi:flagellar hook-length control protein FliK